MPFDKTAYDTQFRREHYDTLKILLPKEDNIKERIKILAEREEISLNQWVIRAIRERLEWYE